MMKKQLLFLTLLIVINTNSQTTSFAGVYETHSNFNARLEILTDSTYHYSESKRGHRIKDTGKVIYQEKQFFLKSATLGLSARKQQKKLFHVYDSHKIRIEILPDKIIIPPCDTLISNSCTYYKLEQSK